MWLVMRVVSFQLHTRYSTSCQWEELCNSNFYLYSLPALLECDHLLVTLVTFGFCPLMKMWWGWSHSHWAPEVQLHASRVGCLTYLTQIIYIGPPNKLSGLFLAIPALGTRANFYAKLCKYFILCSSLWQALLINHSRGSKESSS